MHIRTLTLSALMATQSAAFAQVPVTDAAAITRFIEQIQVAKNQVSQLQSIEGTFKGDRGLWNFLNSTPDKELRKYLPDDVIKILRGGDGQIAARAKALLLEINPDGSGSTIDKERQARSAGTAAAAEGMYTLATRRAHNLDQILQRAGDPSIDAKGMQELTLRLQAEQGFIQAEANQLNALRLAKEARDQIEADKSNRQFSNFLSGQAQRAKP